jgi:hypothetical protein
MLKRDWEDQLANAMATDEQTTILAMGLLELFWAGKLSAEDLQTRFRLMKYEAEGDHARFPDPNCRCSDCRNTDMGDDLHDLKREGVA